MQQAATKLGARNWTGILLIGFAGQLAWAIENNFINLWVYSQAQDSRYITWMTVASAIVATLTTLFMGALSDRLGKRKVFIAGGYVIWGITVFLFALASRYNMTQLFGAAQASLAVGIAVTVIDCVMTFFGSTSNDACFQAHVTDITSESNRGRVEAILSVIPLIANILVVLVASIVGASAKLSVSEAAATSFPADVVLAGHWMTFFLIFGAITTAIGVAAFFLIPPDRLVPNKSESYIRNTVYGFRPSVIKANKGMYIALLGFLGLNTSFDAFMPYYLVYIQNGTAVDGLGYTGMDFYVAFGLILIISSLLTIAVGLFMDKIGKLKLVIPALAVYVGGLIALFFCKQLWSLILAGTIMMFGDLIATAIFGAQIRDETPKQQVGLFQGVRMIFAVLIPMIVGSYTSLLVFTNSYENDFGEMTPSPNRWMFIVAAGFAVLAIVPTVWMVITKKRQSLLSAVAVDHPTDVK